MKKILVLIVFLTANSVIFAQDAASSHTTDYSYELAKLYSQFEKCEVNGHVYRDGNIPVPNVKVKLYLYRGGTGNFGNVSTMPQFANTSKMPKITWAETDKDGAYKLIGVPYPGSYFLEVTGVKGYKKAQSPLRLDMGLGEVITGRNLFLDKFRDKKVEKLIEKMNKAAEGGDLDKAAALAQDVLKKDNAVPEAYVILGNQAIKGKDYQNALVNFEHAMKNGTRNASIYTTSAKLAFQFKKLDQGIEYLKKSGEVGAEKDVAYYQMLAKAYMMKQDKENSVAVIEELLEAHKTFKGREQFEQMLANLKKM